MLSSMRPKLKRRGGGNANFLSTLVLRSSGKGGVTLRGNDDSGEKLVIALVRQIGMVKLEGSMIAVDGRGKLSKVRGGDNFAK